MHSDVRWYIHVGVYSDVRWYIGVLIFPGLTCPAGYDAVGDDCLRPSTNEVASSRDCQGECGDDTPAEVHSAAQRDAMIAYCVSSSKYFYLDKAAS